MTRLEGMRRAAAALWLVAGCAVATACSAGGDGLDGSWSGACTASPAGVARLDISLSEDAVSSLPLAGATGSWTSYAASGGAVVDSRDWGEIEHNVFELRVHQCTSDECVIPCTTLSWWACDANNGALVVGDRAVVVQYDMHGGWPPLLQAMIAHTELQAGALTGRCELFLGEQEDPKSTAISGEWHGGAFELRR